MDETERWLYSQLPEIYRQRDNEYGEPLKEYLELFEKQLNLIEDDINQMHENWYIESSEPWDIPYMLEILGALLAYPKKNYEKRRACVANTIRYRRSKGTLSELESLAHDITGWNSRAAEFFKLIDISKSLKYLHTLNPRSFEVQRHLSTPFGTSTQFYDLQKILRYKRFCNIPNIGIYIWRIQAFPIDFTLPEKKENRFYFSQLFRNIKLYQHPEIKKNIEQITEEKNAPHPIHTSTYFIGRLELLLSSCLPRFDF